MKPLNVAWLLEDTSLSGGTRVAVAQADALVARGHNATVVTRGTPLSWRSSRCRWQFVEAFETFDASEFDFVVGTFWTTLAATFAIAGRRGVHLCQGYEGAFTAYTALKPQIDAAYRLPLPKITVSPHLVEVCRPFYDDATYIGQIVDDGYFRDTPGAAHQPLRVLLCGPSQGDMKGIREGYEAVEHARRAGCPLQLVRVSSWPPAGDEPRDGVEFHVAVPTDAMIGVMHSSDILLAPNHAEEGFGLPAAEAMAACLPTVLTEIPSYLAFSSSRDMALFVPERDGRAMGEALLRLAGDPALRHDLAVRGREVAEQWRAAHTGARLERYFLERRAG